MDAVNVPFICLDVANGYSEHFVNHVRTTPLLYYPPTPLLSSPYCTLLYPITTLFSNYHVRYTIILLLVHLLGCG